MHIRPFALGQVSPSANMPLLWIRSRRSLAAHVGFTLVELLIVIGIIGVLMSVVIVAVNPAKQFRAVQDIKRKQVVNQLQKALQQHLIGLGSYPNDALLPAKFGDAKPICKKGVTGDATCINMDALVPTYIVDIPLDQSETNANYSGYKVYKNGGQVAIQSMYTLGSILTTGLVGYWNFNEGAGTTATDTSGNGLNGSLQLSATWNASAPSLSVDNPFSLSFNGTSSYVELGNPNALQIAGSQTICMWLYPTSFAARRNPFAKAYGGEGTITQETSGVLNYYYGTGGGNALPYSSLGSVRALYLNRWTHVCMVRDLTSMQRYWYFNGELTAQSAAPYASATPSALNAMIGRGYTSDYLGRIDDVRVYNRALSLEEVELIASGEH